MSVEGVRWWKLIISWCLLFLSAWSKEEILENTQPINFSRLVLISSSSLCSDDTSDLSLVNPFTTAGLIFLRQSHKLGDKGTFNKCIDLKQDKGGFSPVPEVHLSDWELKFHFLPLNKDTTKEFTRFHLLPLYESMTFMLQDLSQTEEVSSSSHSSWRHRSINIYMPPVTRSADHDR